MDSVTLLYQEALDLLRDPTEPTTFRYRLEFRIGDSLIETIKVMAYDRINKYDTNVNEEIMVSVAVSTGVYTKVLYPSRKNVKARLYREALDPSNQKPYPTRKAHYKDYNCVFISNESTAITQADGVVNNQALMDRDMVSNVDVQLIDPIANSYIRRSIGTILRDVTMSETIKLLTGTFPSSPTDPEPSAVSEEAWVNGAYSGMVGVDIVPPDNTRRYNHVVIPTGINLIDLPDYLQVKYGIYNNGIGNYIKDGISYTYPLTNTKRIDSTERTLTIVRVPKEKGTGVTSTWRLKDKTELYVLATSNVEHIDVSEAVELNDGIVRYALNSDKVVDGMVKCAGGKATTYVGDNLSFTESHSREDGLSHARLSKDRILSNMFHENSKINSGKVSTLTIDWTHSHPDALYPGMPVVYLFPSGNSIVEMKGILALADSQTYPVTDGYRPSGHSTSTTLGIIVESVGTA